MNLLAATAAHTFIFFFAVSLSASLGMGVSLTLFELNKFYGLRSVGHVCVKSLHVAEGQFHVSYLRECQRVGELNLENNKQVSELERGLVEGQTFLWDSLQVIGLNNFAGLVLHTNLGSI